MNLLLKRQHKESNYTIGDLYIDGQFFSNTLEDKDRNLNQSMTQDEIAKIKIYGRTAIPCGTYKITMDVVSEKFKDRSWAKPYSGKIPRLINVPGFEGVLIHPGNDEDDTYGCILVGSNDTKGKVCNSQETFHKLMNILLSGSNITITIE